MTPAAKDQPPTGVHVVEEEESELTVLDLPDLPGIVDTVALFPDGTTVAACGEDGRIQLYRVPSKEVTANFDGYPGVPQMAFSPDGRLLAQGSEAHTSVRVWNVEEQRELKTLEGNALTISDVVFAPDSDKLATSGRSSVSATDGEIRIWTLSEDAEPVSLKPNCGISAIAFSPDGKYLASAGVAKPLDDGPSTGETTVWDLEDQSARTTFTSAYGSAYQVAFSGDGKTLAIAERNGPRPTQVADRVLLIDPLTGENKGVLLGHMGTIHGLAFHPSGQFLVTAAQDKFMRIWQVSPPSLRTLIELRGYHSGPVTFSDDGQLFAVTVRRNSSTPRPTVWSFEYALGEEARQQSRWPAGTAPLRARLLMIPSRVQIYDVAFSEDGKTLGFSNYRSGTWLYDMTTWKGRNLGDFRPIAFSRDLKRAATLRDTLKIWDVETAQLVFDPGDAVQFIEPGYAMAATAIEDVAFSHDAKYLASTHGASVRIWDLETGKLTSASRHPEGFVTSLAFSGDATKLVSGSGLFQLEQGRINCVGPISVWDLNEKQAPDSETSPQPADVESLETEWSEEAQTTLERAGEYWRSAAADKPLDQDPRVVRDLQTIASTIPEIRASTMDEPRKVYDLQLNTLGTGLDAVRFKSSRTEPSDLLFSLVVPTDIKGLSDWALIPAAGPVAENTKRRFFGAVALSLDPRTGRAQHCEMSFVLEGGPIQPGADYIVCFAFDAHTAVPIRASVMVLPEGKLKHAAMGWPLKIGGKSEVPATMRTNLFFHGAKLASVAISPDGNTIASVGKDGLIKVWNASTEETIATCSGHLAEFSPDGSILAATGTGEELTSVVLWDPKTGKKIRTLKGGHCRGICALAFSADGKRLASGGRDGWVTVWDPQTGEQAWDPVVDQQPSRN
jgi:WD40 repeat protein